MQVEFLIIDINLNTPRISAMEVFEIGPNLFPSVLQRNTSSSCLIVPSNYSFSFTVYWSGIDESDHSIPV